MIFACELAIRGLDLRFGRIARRVSDLVVTLELHRSPAAMNNRPVTSRQEYYGRPSRDQLSPGGQFRQSELIGERQQHALGDIAPQPGPPVVEWHGILDQRADPRV